MTVSYEFKIPFSKMMKYLQTDCEMSLAQAEESLVSCLMSTLGLSWKDDVWIEDANGKTWIISVIFSGDRAMTFKLKYGDLIVD